MAKSVTKTTNIWDGLDPVDEKVVTTHETTHTHEHTQLPKVKETKNRRVQLLTYGSIVDRMDNYAKLYGLSRAEVFEQAVTEYLNQRNS